MEENGLGRCLPGRLRAGAHPRYRLVWPRHVRAAQADQGVLRDEDPREGEGGEAEADRAHAAREADTAVDQFPIFSQYEIPF